MHNVVQSRRRLPMLAIIALLTACAASPPVRYYALEAPAPDGPAGVSGRIMVVGPIAIPEYLQRPQLVRRTPGAALEIDDFHRWAEPLEDAVPRVLAQNLNALGTEFAATPAPAHGVDADWRLNAVVLSFEADAAGTVGLVVQWSITDLSGSRTEPWRTDQYRADAPAREPGAVAAAMSELLARFAADVAAALAASAPMVGVRAWRAPAGTEAGVSVCRA